MALDVESRTNLERVLVWTTVIAAVADSAVTYVGLRWMEGREGGLIAGAMIEAWGLGPGLLVRTLVMVILVLVAWRAVTIPFLRMFGLIVVAVINVGVIGWNLATML